MTDRNNYFKGHNMSDCIGDRWWYCAECGGMPHNNKRATIRFSSLESEQPCMAHGMYPLVPVIVIDQAKLIEFIDNGFGLMDNQPPELGIFLDRCREQLIPQVEKEPCENPRCKNGIISSPYIAGIASSNSYCPDCKGTGIKNG